MVPFLQLIFYIFLKWYHFWWQFSSFFGMVYFCRGGKFSSFSEMGPLLLRIFGTLLEWYHYCRRFLALSWNGTIFVYDFWYFSLMVPFLLPNFRKFFNWYLFLFHNFRTFLKWFHFCSDFSHFAQMVSFFVCDFWYFSLIMVPYFVAEYSHIPQLVSYLLQIFRTFLKWYHFCFNFSALCSNR